MASVTIPSSGASTINETFGNTANAQLATQIRDALVTAGLNGVLGVTPTTSLNVPAPPVSKGAGGVNELVITAGGDYTIPAGSAGASDYVVVLDTAAAVTIHGAPNATILGGLGNVTIIDPADIVLSEENGNAVVTVTGTGDVVAGNNKNDALTAAGNAGSISGGTGTNSFVDLGSNDTISAQGFGGPGKLTIQIASNAIGEKVVGGEGTLFVTDAALALNPAGGDTIFGGDGTLNVTTSGTFARVIGGDLGGIRALDTGTSDTIFAGGGGMTVTLAGSSKAAVVVGQSNLSVIDNGINDTIIAGSGSATVTAATSAAFVRGGAGLLSFVGGAGNSTIIGGSGDSTVFGSTGATSLFGSAGGAMTYVNTTAGGVYYTAGSGNETIDASLSKSSVSFNETLSRGGHNLMIGGAGSDAFYTGADVDTLVGGGGANTFDFWKQFGGPAANHVISDFSAIDAVLLISYGSGEAAAAIAGANTTGGSTTITLSDNTRITFTGVTDPAALTGHIHQA